MNIDKNIKDKKEELLAYFRDRATEFLTQIKTKFADTQPNQRGDAINKAEDYKRQPNNNFIATSRQRKMD